jgi:uncharacterized repeat protein (TIGR01451 family)
MWHKYSCLLVLGGVGVAVLLALPSTARAQAGPNLVIAMSHRGNFTVGENGVYTIVVSNIGGTATSGAMYVQDGLTGLPFTFVSGTGTGWDCFLSEHGPPGGAFAICESISAIGPGASAFPITLTVIPTVSGTWTNTVGLSAGREVITIPSASDPTIVVAAVPTLPQWAMIVLTALLALAGVTALRRRTT